MADSQRFFNQWALHFQKLSLELKCPLCLNLFNRPVLLPCNHIFCNCCIPRLTQFGSECPACKHHYVDREIRPAPYMENMVTIYKSLDATVNANLFLPVFSDLGRVSEQCHVSFKTDAGDKLRMEHVKTPKEENSSNGQSIFLLTANNCIGASVDGCLKEEFEMRGGCKMVCKGEDKLIPLQSRGQVGAEKQVEIGTEEIDMCQMEQLSPGNSASFGGTKDTSGNSSDPRSNNSLVEKYKLKRSVEIDSDRAGAEMNNRFTPGAKCHTGDVKRQKTLNDGFFEMGVKSDCHTRQKKLLSENTISNCKLKPKFGEPFPGMQLTVISDSPNADGSVCAFCHSSELTDGTGPMLCYANGKEVVGYVATTSKVIHVHRKCIDWTPRAYYEGEKIKNLESELARAAKLKCSSCGLKGAALGCSVKSCRKSYHVPCAFEIVDCKWDCENFLLLCPIHNSVKFPREKSKSGKQASGKNNPVSTHQIEYRISLQPNFWATSPNGAKEWVFCGSALSAEEKYQLVKFASYCGATVSSCWKQNVTHVIAATDAKGACTRTLKVLMAILNGKWILNMDWIKACMEAKHPVDEDTYEVGLDNHGCCGGPKTGRLRALENAPKLFNSLNFYFSGDFVPGYKNDLLNLVMTAGGTVIESREQLVAQIHDGQATPSTTLIVYNADPIQWCTLGEEDYVVLKRLTEAEDLADQIGSRVIKQTWILDSIAACQCNLLVPAIEGFCNEDDLRSPGKSKSIDTRNLGCLKPCYVNLKCSE